MQVGEHAPNFDLESHEGNRIRLAQFRDKKNVVVFFYPKDDTPG